MFLFAIMTSSGTSTLAPFLGSSDWVVEDAVDFHAQKLNLPGSANDNGKEHDEQLPHVFVDLGCGDARLVSAFWQRTSGTVTAIGMEFDARYVAVARQRLRDECPGAEIVADVTGEVLLDAKLEKSLFLLHTDVLLHEEFVARRATRIVVFLCADGLQKLAGTLTAALSRPNVRVSSYMWPLPEAVVQKSACSVRVVTRATSCTAITDLFLYTSAAA